MELPVGSETLDGCNAFVIGACGQYQAPEIRVQFRRATGQIQYAQACVAHEPNEIVCRLPPHDFGPFRPCIDMTVQAGLVTQVADIDLQRFQFRARNGREVALSQ